MDKKYELSDELLDLVSGGKVVESVYAKIDQLVVEAIQNNYPKSVVKAMLSYAYTRVTDQMSDDGSFKDLTTILAYFDKKWKEVYGE